jgi:hypothetical protein
MSARGKEDPSTDGISKSSAYISWVRKDIGHIIYCNTTNPLITNHIIDTRSALAIQERRQYYLWIGWSEARIQLQSNPTTSLMGTKSGCNRESYNILEVACFLLELLRS